MFLLSCDCYCSVSLPRGVVGWSVVVTFSGHTHLLCFRPEKPRNGVCAQVRIPASIQLRATIGPPGKCHSDGASLAGRKWSDFTCLLGSRQPVNATETSQNIGSFAQSKFGKYTFQTANNKCTDQISRIRMLVCVFVVCIQQN